ncbi:MAG: Ig-like domain-containing protein [Myxococcota bacterium]
MLRTPTAVFLVVVCAGCPVARPDPAPLPSAGAPVRVELSPGAFILPEGATRTLQLRAFDADGAEVPPGDVRWSSSRPGEVAVDGSGVVSFVQVGSATVTATVGELSASAVVAAVRTAPGAFLVSDAQLGRRLEPVDTTTPFGLGFRFRVELIGVAPPAPGTIIIASETAPLAGRVVAVSGQTVTVEIVTAAEVFPAIAFRETFRGLPPDVPARTLGQVTASANPNGTTTYSVKRQPLEFELGPFDCEAEASVEPQFRFDRADFTLTDGPVYEVEFTDARQRLVMTDEPVVDVALKPVLSGELAGSLECKLELFTREIPVPGPVGIFLGATMLAGVGFGLEAKTPLGDGVSVLVSGQLKARLRVGVECADFSCTPVKEVEVQRSTGRFTPTADVALPTAAPRVDLQADVFAWAGVKAGVTILRRFSFDTPRELELDVVEARAGLRATASVATEARQVQEKFYSASYGLGLHAEVAAGKHLDRVLTLLGAALGVSFEVADVDLAVASSPRASVELNQRTFTAGDTVRAAVRFDAATIDFPLVGENLEKVRLLKVVRAQDGGSDVVLVPMAEQIARPGESAYTLSGVATQDSRAEDYVVFATSKVWTSLSLEQEQRCTVPAGYAYCVVDNGVADFWPVRRGPDGRVFGFAGAVGRAVWEAGKPLEVLPPRPVPPDPNPQEALDHNDRRETLYVLAYDVNRESYLVRDGGVVKTVPMFRGVKLNNRGQLFGARYVPETSPGAEDDFEVPALFDGASVVDVPGGLSFTGNGLADTGLVVGTLAASGAEPVPTTFPGGALPLPTGFTSGEATVVSESGEFIGGRVLVAGAPAGSVVWRNRVPTLVPVEPMCIDRAGRILARSQTQVLELDGGVVDLLAASFPRQGAISCTHLSDDGILSCVTAPADGGAQTFSFLEPANPAP